MSILAPAAAAWLMAAAAARPPEPTSPWPRPIPVRLKPRGRDDLLVTTLGIVETPLADGVFDPVADRVTTSDGRTLERYVKDQLEVPFYQPIDKSRFPLPPSGWCSWYYYYQEIDEGEVVANARWLARHLAPYGAHYVQIDDGWQGTGHGLGTNRDWTTIDVRFRKLGMDGLAREIRGLGLEAGLWLAPHGQSNESVARAAQAFLWKTDGSSAAPSWEGTYLLDPSVPAAQTYLNELFTRLRSWGYSYFKIDGQPTVVREYGNPSHTQSWMKGSVPPGSPEAAGTALYRDTLGTIRRAIGPDSFLLTSWGTALQAMGLIHGARTGGDVFQGRDGMLVAVDAVHRLGFLHNIGWYSDPDVLLVRPPLSEGMARAWATLFGLTGHTLMSSDRLTDLPESRLELLRRVYPATDIRPLDLYRPDNTLKPVVDLKVHHAGRSYDVVGVFNYETEAPLTRLLSWQELGLPAEAAFHVYDFWEGSYLGAWQNGVFVDVPPVDVRLLTLVQESERPVLISTSRHLTQGWLDVLDIQAGGTRDRPTLAGHSRVVAGDRYRLTIGLPRRSPTFRLAAAKARSESGRAIEVNWESHQGYATATVTSPTAQTIAWTLSFEPAQPYLYPVESPAQLQAFPLRAREAALRWPVEYHVKAGYQVELDGRPLGVAFAPRAVLRDLVPGRSYTIGVRSAWYDGSVDTKKVGQTTYTPVLPVAPFLSDLEPIASKPDWGSRWRPFGRDRSIDGHPLRVAGREYARGLGTHASWELRYDLAEAYARFSAAVGLDDETRPEKPNEAVFEVWADGRLLWRSEAVKAGAEPQRLDLDVRGVAELTLKALPGSDGTTGDHADWLEPRLEAAVP
jgi:hypothetical protein